MEVCFPILPCDSFDVLYPVTWLYVNIGCFIGLHLCVKDDHSELFKQFEHDQTKKSEGEEQSKNNGFGPLDFEEADGLNLDFTFELHSFFQIWEWRGKFLMKRLLGVKDFILHR